MNMIATKHGAQIHSRDWRTGQPVVFSHGWPFRSQTWGGNDMDTYADVDDPLAFPET